MDCSFLEARIKIPLAALLMNSAASLRGGGSEIICYNSLFYCRVNLVCSLHSPSQGEAGWVRSAIIGPGLPNRKTGFYYSQLVGIVGSKSIIFAMLSEGAALLIKPVRGGFPPDVCCSAGTSDFVIKVGKKNISSGCF